MKLNFYLTGTILTLIILFSFFGLVGSSEAKELFVSTTGNDDVTYANNDISHSWATPDKAWHNAQAGDTVNFRSGIYYVSIAIDTRFNSYDGTVENPIIFQNYQEESVTIDFTQIIGDDNSGLQIQRNYNYIDGINFVADNFDTADDCIIRLGEDSATTGFKITNCSLTCTSAAGTDNVCLIRTHPGAENIIIEDNIFTGPSGASSYGVSGIQMFRTGIISINRNEISNCAMGIFHKHSNYCLDQGFYVTNNYIYDCGIGIRTITNYGHYENNLVVNCLHYGVKLGDNGGTGYCGVGGDNNFFDHNTFYNTIHPVDMVEQSNTCDDNEFTNNLYVEKLTLYEYKTIVGSMTTTSNYNLYMTGNIINEAGTNYTLAEWQIQNSSDTNSLSGASTFVGGANPSLISDFALTSESLGYQSASDGEDIGVDVSLIGVNAGDETPPSHPTGLSVE